MLKGRRTIEVLADSSRRLDDSWRLLVLLGVSIRGIWRNLQSLQRVARLLFRQLGSLGEDGGGWRASVVVVGGEPFRQSGGIVVEQRLILCQLFRTNSGERGRRRSQWGGVYLINFLMLPCS